MTPEQNWNRIVAITRATDEPNVGETLDLEQNYGDARRAAILWADGELTRLRLERGEKAVSEELKIESTGEKLTEAERVAAAVAHCRERIEHYERLLEVMADGT